MSKCIIKSSKVSNANSGPHWFINEWMPYYLFSYPFTPNYIVHGKTVNIFKIPSKRYPNPVSHLLKITYITPSLNQ